MVRYNQILGKIVLVAIIVFAVAFAMKGNLDLREGRPFLFMDETIAFDGVKKILGADTFSTFGYAVVDGADHRYGRVFYNASAVIAALPYYFWGDAGLIVGVRAAQVIFLLSAYILLACASVKNAYGRALIVLVLLFLPFTSYYFSQPKPEPLQILFLATFALYARRQGFGFGGHWIWAGLAFGAKISAAPAVAAAGLVALVVELRQNNKWLQRAKKGAISFGSFLAGWLIAVPILAIPNKQHIDSYLHWTFQSTGHGLDDKSINAIVWLKQITGGEAIRYYVTPTFMGLIYLAVSVLLLGIGASILLRKREHLFFPCFLIFMAGALIVPIVLKVQRIWGFYLHPASVLGICGLAAACEVFLSRKDFAPKSLGYLRILGASSVVLAGALYCLKTRNSVVRDYVQLSERTQQPEYISKRDVYEKYTKDIEQLSERYTKESGRKFKVAFDPYLFLPDSTSRVQIVPIWGPFNDWNGGYDLIILGERTQWAYLSGALSLPPESSANYANWLSARQEFKRLVATSDADEKSKSFHVFKSYNNSVFLIEARPSTP